MAVRPALNLRIADHLLDNGLIGESDHRHAVECARDRNMRIEEALLELDLVTESELLQAVSKLHETQFVSTERMSRAKVDRNALRLVPKKVALLYGVFPLLYEATANRLVVATADPDNLAALDEIRVASRVREVRPLVARPAAVSAAIARGYDDETYAFTDLLRGTSGFGEIELGDPFTRTDSHQVRPPAGRSEPQARPPGPPARPVRAPEPRYRSPLREEPGHRAPAREEPGYRQPAREEPGHRAPAREEPAYRQPAREEPAYRQPAREEPVYRQPAREEPGYRAPMREEPGYRAPMREEPAYRPTAGEEANYRGAAREEPAYRQPVPEARRGEVRGVRPEPRPVARRDDFDDEWGEKAVPQMGALDDPFGGAARATGLADRREVVDASPDPQNVARSSGGATAIRGGVSPARPVEPEPGWRMPDDALVGGLPAGGGPGRPDAPVYEPEPPTEPSRDDQAQPEGGGGTAVARVALQSRVGRAADLLRDPPAGGVADVGGLPLVGTGAAYEAPAAAARHDPRAEPASVRPRGPTGASRSLPPPPSRLQFGPHARRPSERPPSMRAAIPALQLIEVLRVLVGLLENEREELRGHSSTVARLAQDAAERIRLSDEQAQALVIACYMHDLGKRATVSAGRRSDQSTPTLLHLTPLNVAQFAPHRELAQKLVDLPDQLMSGAGMPDAALSALGTMYEQFGGRGIPGELSGSDIPIEGRILAVAESYADLTQNAANAYGRVMSPEDAMAELRRHAGVVFDPNIVDVFEHALGGEKILHQLLDDRHRVLIVDPDPEQTLVLQLRLSDQGFEVHLARSTKEARAALGAHKFALVVSEIDIEDRDAGLFLREEVSRRDDADQIAWVFLSGRSTRNTAKRAFDLGVDDFIAKPTSADIVVAKLVQIVERQVAKPVEAKPEAARGVAGSLSDMGVTDLVQVLWHGRRTCALHVETDDTKGQLNFLEGRLVHATWGDAVGETAFYRLLAYSDNGRFRVDPSYVPEGEPTITGSPEGMLLEAMRLIDENRVP